MDESLRFELSPGDPRYPRLMRDLGGEAPTLRGYGDPAALRPGLAVIGARKATPYGLTCAARLVGWAADAGYVIISGGAIGCDQAAHHAALSAGGLTVAVMGNGADVVYPSGAVALLERIAASGAVISEFDWGFRPTRWSFVRRNRLIAALSQAVLVLEAGLGSGTFSTAEFALDLGREVLAVPGSVFAPECAGTNRLIRQGATPVTEPDDLRAALEMILGPARVPGTPSTRTASEDPVFRAVRTNPARPDDLARQLAMDVVTVARRLGMLEAAGLVQRFPDGRIGAVC